MLLENQNNNHRVWNNRRFLSPKWEDAKEEIISPEKRIFAKNSIKPEESKVRDKSNEQVGSNEEVEPGSEVDIDEYLLGSRQQSKASELISVNKIPNERWHSNIVIDKGENNTSKEDIDNTPIMNSPSELPETFCKRSNTVEKSMIQNNSKMCNKSRLEGNTSGIQNTITGISQLSACSKFISPALKRRLNKQSSRNEESYISENLPSAFLSIPSYDQNILEEIKELQTRENVDSNPTEPRLGKNKKSPETVSPGSFTFKGASSRRQAQNKTFTEAINLEKTRPKGPAIYGNIIRWTMGPRLGFGVFGDVVKAINRRTGEIFAVKRLSLQKNETEYNKEAINSLKSEINILRQLDHRNIIRYIGSEIIGADFCIYLEYASEGSLLNAYKEFGPFDEELIRIYTRQILEGLHFLHSKSIVHQDLK